MADGPFHSAGRGLEGLGHLGGTIHSCP
jgi:hypothetical protein